MANIDLASGQANSVRSAYQNYLGRDAADDEVSNWLSGAYGHGDQSNLDPVLNAIRDSDEARRRTPTKGPTSDQPPPVVGQPPPGVSGPQTTSQPAPPVAPPWDPAVWNQAANQITSAYQEYLKRSASDDEVTNWLTGKHGWGAGPAGVDAMLKAIQDSEEARALRPPPTTPPTTTTTPPPGGYQSYVMNLFAGKAPNPKVLESMAGELAKYGIKLGPRNASGFIDTVILPDGSAWDIIQAATPDGGVSWQWIKAGGGSGGPNVSTPGLPGVSTPGPQFSDPYSLLLEQLLSGRINELLQPVNDTARQQYADAMQQRATALGGAETQYTQLMDFLQKRFEELQQPGYTGAENEVLRTQALDPIERDRAAARQRVLERLSARGLNLESGIAQQALNAVDAEFDSFRAENQTALASNELARREDRSQRAASIGGQLVDIPQARQREQLDVFSALNDLSGSVRSEEEARRREAISYGGALADLPVQRLQLAMQAAGMGGTPQSMLQSLVSVANSNQMQQQLGQNRWSSLMNGIGSISAILANAGRR